ncbi:dickkopf-related protein 1-like [Anguilla rostrata]|uniref:dickkopf-related protein 1-like n=1 Tax=Anguilla rostrata TaxID=7938 RepID=UPI0030D15BA7
MFLVSAPVIVVVCFTLCACIDDSYDGPIQLNSNAIKNLPDGVTSPNQAASPDLLPSDGGSQNIAIDTLQARNCANDEECSADEFCNDSRRACLKCRKPRKRCARDAMCCPGNQCVTGKCLSSYDSGNHHVGHNRSLERPAKRTHPGGSQPLKAQESESCLRSSDCAEGLCCARHFWSRICKPVLTSGQVCSKHKRKGSQGVEIFQRCDCGDGLTCRALKGRTSKATRRLNTCQRR